MLSYFICTHGIGTSAKGNQSQSSGGCNPAAMGGCLPQVTPPGGCESTGGGAPCPLPTSPGGCANNGNGGQSCSPPAIGGCGSMGGTGGSLPCPPHGMPSGVTDCGGESTGGGPSCVTVDTGCVVIDSQPMVGAPCVGPGQGMTPGGGCTGMGTEAMPGTACVIQGKLVEGCPNVTTGGSPCPPTGQVTGGCVTPSSSCGNGTTNGTSMTGPNPKPGPNPAPSKKI